MTGPALKPSPVLLMVLSMLNERPMHPYEMQRLVVERAKNAVINIKRGSIYHAVERLQHAGLIEELETSREGRRPERTVYRLTEIGREEVRHWMRAMLTLPKQEYPEFATVMAFLPVLEPWEVLSALRQRLAQLEGLIARTGAMLGSVSGRLPRVFLVEEEYHLAMLRAERDWVAALVADFDSGAFTWNVEEFAQYRPQPPAPGGPPAPDSREGAAEVT